MSRLPPVIASTLRVICTQYCPHLLTPGILIPANTKKQEKPVKYRREKTACHRKLCWFSPTLFYLAEIILDVRGLD